MASTGQGRTTHPKSLVIRTPFTTVRGVRTVLMITVLLLAAAACGKDATYTDAGFTDGGVTDGGGEPIDAPPPLPAYEITGGARGLTGKRFRADVQVGHGVGQQPVRGGGTTAEGNAAVKR